MFLMIFISPSTLPVSSPTIAIWQLLIYSNDAGTAVEARYIAIDSVSSWAANTHVDYSIDGTQIGSASREPINQADYFYNQTLFHISGLENTNHVLRVELRNLSVLLVSVPY